MNTEHIGKPISRVDGPAKVTGAAGYAAESRSPASSRRCRFQRHSQREVARIDATDALQLPGVLQVFTHENSPQLAPSDDDYRRCRSARFAFSPTPWR